MISTLATKGWRNSRWRLAMWSVVGALLLVPAVAMQFTHEVGWTFGDFVTAAVILSGAGMVGELIARSPLNAVGKMAAATAVLILVLAVWAQGAVGIF